MTPQARGSQRSAPVGFTLVELLVVIAILALLAGILMPVFAQARFRSYQATCLSNMRQLSMAVLAYCQDNDEAMPNGVNVVGSSPGGVYTGGYAGRVWPAEGWAGQCSPYLRSAAVLRCPSDPTQGQPPYSLVSSYGLNGNVAAYADQDDPVPSGLRLSAFAAPTRTVLLFEVSGVVANVTDLREGIDSSSTGVNFSASGNGLDNRLYAQKDWTTRTDNQYATGYLGGRKPFDPGATQFPYPEGRHAAGANFAFADGHVRPLPGGQVSSGLNAQSERCPQGDGSPSVAADCGGGFQAAGTAAPGFTATFSIR